MTLAAISSDAWIETLFSGVALGSKYALVALGFVIVFKATGVINFAQASFVLLGGYFSWNITSTWDLDFYLSLPLAMVGGAIVGVLLEWLVLRRLVGEAPFTLIMVTIGVLYVLDATAEAIWGPSDLDLPDPWGTRTVNSGDVNLAQADLWAIGVTAVVLVAFFAFFRYSTLGLAMAVFTFLLATGSKLIASYLVGDLIFERLAPQAQGRRVWALVVGVLIYVILAALPFIGWVFAWIATFLGLGAIWFAWQKRQPVAAETPAI